jgi:circadian clock protein KaiB
MPADETNDTSAFEDALADAGDACYIFRLYVSGSTPRSLRAVQNLRQMCEAHLQGRYQLEVVDIYQQPGEAQSNQIVVTPTLVKSLPVPPRRLIGDLSHADRLLISLDIVTPADPASKTSTEVVHDSEPRS